MSDALIVSAGTHFGLGFNYSSNSAISSNSFVLDLPVVAELNFGRAAGPNSDNDFDGFLGFGYGISKMCAEGAFGVGRNDAVGIIVNGGIRARIYDNPVGLRVAYLLNFKSGAEDVLTVGLFYTFGDF